MFHIAIHVALRVVGWILDSFIAKIYLECTVSVCQIQSLVFEKSNNGFINVVFICTSILSHFSAFMAVSRWHGQVEHPAKG